MKKAIALILSMIIALTLSVPVFAKNGDVAGYIYSTDIRAYINGVEIQSYNIGGKTAVVIEDILNENSHQYSYDDSSRTLKFFSLNPSSLVESKSQNKIKPGKVVGKIYETDIKTSIYDVTVPTYNIGGKTAVAIEELGCDREFSSIGGKYIWNEEERTISLEFLYQNSGISISGDRYIYISANEDMTEAKATFNEVLHCGGGREHFTFPEYVTDDTELEVVMPIKAQDEVIGYYFRRPSRDYKFTAFTYYYPEKVKEAEKTFVPDENKTREAVIGHFVSTHSVGEPRERFDTDDYSFVYISVAMTSSTPHNLLQVFDDGSYIDYKDIITMRNRSPKNLVVDKENEKVRFKYVDRYNSEWLTDYEIDLKKGEIKAINNLNTDIGIGTADGNPSESEQTESRNAQYEYKLISGEDEKIVEGFFTNEYYYADMLPLKDTFDFLNIKYSFENDILTIDTTEARPLSLEKTENKTDVLGENPPDYLYVEKVLLNGEETSITYPYISGHFDRTSYGRAKAKPYVCNGKVYINASFVSWLYNK